MPWNALNVDKKTYSKEDIVSSISNAVSNLDFTIDMNDDNAQTLSVQIGGTHDGKIYLGDVLDNNYQNNLISSWTTSAYAVKSDVDIVNERLDGIEDKLNKMDGLMDIVIALLKGKDDRLKELSDEIVKKVLTDLL